MWFVFVFFVVAVLALVLGFLVDRAARRQKAARLHHADLVQVLLGLGERELAELFRLYAEQFGPEAAKYARRTHRKWKSGEVRPNRRTFERLLVHLPRVMSFDLKCEVLRKLREEYCAKDEYQLTVGTDDWRETLAPLVEELVAKSYRAELPEPVEKKLRWLADDDMRVARALLDESQAVESRNALSMLAPEFDSIERLLEGTGGRGRVTHTIRLPAGTITLKIRRG